MLNQVTVLFRQPLRTKDTAVPRRLVVIPFPVHNYRPLDAGSIRGGSYVVSMTPVNRRNWIKQY